MEEGSFTKIFMGLLFGFGIIALARLMRGKSPKNDEQKKELPPMDPNAIYSVMLDAADFLETGSDYSVTVYSGTGAQRHALSPELSFGMNGDRDKERAKGRRKK